MRIQAQILFHIFKVNVNARMHFISPWKEVFLIMIIGESRVKCRRKDVSAWYDQMIGDTQITGVRFCTVQS
mgnify:CR=1 FL=1